MKNFWHVKMKSLSNDALKIKEKITVLCTVSDPFFLNGLSEILKQSRSINDNIIYLDEFNKKSIEKADLIIINNEFWKLKLCQPFFKFRKSHSRIFLFGNRETDIDMINMPLCYKALIFFHYKDSLTEIKNKISNALVFNERKAFNFRKSYCSECNQARSSVKQIEIIKLIKSGKTPCDISQIKNIPLKIVYSYKYRFMKKYCLKNNKEFIQVLSKCNLISLGKGIYSQDE